MALMSGERQVDTGKGIRSDHTARYHFATRFLKKGDAVLDAMCGVGYGSFTLALTDKPKVVVAFDKDEETIEYAKKKYAHPLIEYHCEDYADTQFEKEAFDLIVCFEAIEHLDNPLGLLCSFSSCLKDTGHLLVSTPNQSFLPFDRTRFPEHHCHYTPSELETILGSCGFKVVSWHSQKTKVSHQIEKGPEGSFMIAVCQKL